MDSAFTNRSRCTIGCTVNRPCLIAYLENSVASSNDSRGIANNSKNHGGLVRLKGLDSSATTEMSICSLVRLEDHDSFNWLINFDLIERFSEARRVFASDSKQNRIGTVRTNEYLACFGVHIVEGRSAIHCIHSSYGILIHPPYASTIFMRPIGDYLESMIAAEVGSNTC